MPVSFNSLNLNLIKKVKLIYSDSTYSIKTLIVCNTFFSRLKGMLFSKENHKNAYLIIPCNSIHTFFMGYSIDVVFLNKSGDIVSQFNVDPFKTKSEKEAFAVLEGTRLLKSNNNIVQVVFLC
ncbi:conserved hypothetical protein [Thermotomaculum hydrothermale]|uniref:DUF192 domain-containing protein n=1 Tax=Thermotomaculum hydrothermale TaxID=981385 RepID=A0A7R6PNH0_9BACT|nr:DUF192 domain-containing protein [Thermotomaculum hydrothermale]BBB32331.1 conserved hypothetical protein [Thermotomaculum hydrothermale]